MTSMRRRATTASPTVPPDPAERIVARLKPWHVLAGLIAAIFLAGVAYEHSRSGLATQVDLEQVRAGAAAQLGAMQASASAQLGALQSQQADAAARLAALEAHLDDMSKVTDRLLSQVIEIAKVTGARQVPAPAPPTNPNP